MVKWESIEELPNSTKSLSYLKGDLKERYIKYNIPTVWGVLIYAYSQASMYRNIYSKMGGLICTETDSALALKTKVKSHIKENKWMYGDNMGQLGIEYMEDKHGKEIHARAIVISKKCMVIYDHDEWVNYLKIDFNKKRVRRDIVRRMIDKKMFKGDPDILMTPSEAKLAMMTKLVMLKSTFKGVNQSTDKIITQEQLDLLDTDEKKYRWYWDDDEGEKIGMDTYLKMVRREPDRKSVV